MERKTIDEFDSFSISKSTVSRFSNNKVYYATADVDGLFITGKGEIVDWDTKPSRAQITPKLNTINFARMNNTYKVIFFTEDDQDIVENVILSSGFISLESKSKWYFPFALSLIKSEMFHKYKDAFATGATQVSLTNLGFHKIKLYEPQSKIIENYGKQTYSIFNEIKILMKKNKLLQETRDLLLPRLISGKLNVETIDIDDMT